jgi:dTDP-4-amino-4,6-dideoxygalactose transaminase
VDSVTPTDLSESPVRAGVETHANPVATTEPEARVTPLALPRLPVLGWASFSGARGAPLPSVLDLPGAMLTSSGRAAIALALRSLGLRNGDRVLVPTYHCPTMVAPIVAAGAKPAFYPIDATGAPWLEAIENTTKNVRAMIVAHYFGLPQPMSRVRDFCDERGIVMIEDCAHTMFGEVEGRPAGSFGDFAIASLTKFFPTTDGGCLVAKDPGWPGAVLHRRTVRDEVKAAANAIEMGVQRQRLPGVNTLLGAAFEIAGRLSKAKAGHGGDASICANNAIPRDWLEDFADDAIAWRQPSKWTRWTVRHVHRERIIVNRRRNYVEFARLMENLPGTHALVPNLPHSCAPYVFPLWVDEPERTYQRVRAAGIPVFRWDELWSSTPTLVGDSGFQWSTHIFQLGCHQDLRTTDIAQMAEALHAIFA